MFNYLELFSGTWSDGEIVADEGTISRNISDSVYDHLRFAHVINGPRR